MVYFWEFSWASRRYPLVDCIVYSYYRCDNVLILKGEKSFPPIYEMYKTIIEWKAFNTMTDGR